MLSHLEIFAFSPFPPSVIITWFLPRLESSRARILEHPMSESMSVVYTNTHTVYSIARKLLQGRNDLCCDCESSHWNKLRNTRYRNVIPVAVIAKRGVIGSRIKNRTTLFLFIYAVTGVRKNSSFVTYVPIVPSTLPTTYSRVIYLIRTFVRYDFPVFIVYYYFLFQFFSTNANKLDHGYTITYTYDMYL